MSFCKLMVSDFADVLMSCRLVFKDWLMYVCMYGIVLFACSNSKIAVTSVLMEHVLLKRKVFSW